MLALLTGFGTISSCEMRSNATGDYLEVIGESEQTMSEAGFRLNLSYNGPLSMRGKFTAWADSLQKEIPDMVLTSDNIYINYMPEQMGQEKIQPNMMQSIFPIILLRLTAPYTAACSEICCAAIFPLT